MYDHIHCTLILRWVDNVASDTKMINPLIDSSIKRQTQKCVKYLADVIYYNFQKNREIIFYVRRFYQRQL